MKWYVLISMAGVDAIAATTVTQGRLDTSGGCVACSVLEELKECKGGREGKAG